MINDAVDAIVGNVRAMLSGLVSDDSINSAAEIIRKISFNELRAAHLEEAQWLRENWTGYRQDVDKRIAAIKCGELSI